MTRKVWSILGRLVVLAITALLIVANLVIGSWYWRVSEKLRLHQELKRLSAPVAERYNAQVREARRLEAMTHWVRDREDFPVSSGDEIVSRVLPVHPQGNRRGENTAGIPNEVRALIYIPPGDHRLRYSYQEYWTTEQMQGINDFRGYGPKNKRGWERNAVTLNLPTGKVHEIAFSVEQVGEKTELQVSVPGHDERNFPLPPCTVVRHSGFGDSYIKKTFPNQHVNELDENNRSGVWRRSEIMLNEALYYGVTLQRRRDVVQHNSSRYSGSGSDEGELRLCCWIESDVPVSVSAVLVAAHGKEFIDQQRVIRPAVGGDIGTLGGPVPDVDKLFEPYDGSGNLYYATPGVR